MLKIREIAYQSTDYAAELELRNNILRIPLGMNLMDENLEKEQFDFHLGAFENHVLIGVLVLSSVNDFTLKMRQVAIDSRFQGNGIGQKLVHFSEHFASEKGFTKMVLHARKTAIPFYLKLGYQLIDNEFFEVGIPHQKMNKNLVVTQN